MSQASGFEEGVPELSDEFLQEYLNVESVVEYRAIIKNQLEKDRALEAKNGIKNQVWNEILKNSTVIKYPEEEIEFRKARAMMEFNYNAAKYNIEISGFITQISGMALEEFIDKEIMPGAKNDVKQDLVLRAIAAKEGIYVTKDEFDKEVKRFIEEYGYENEEAFLTLNGENAVWIALLSEKVIDRVMATAVEK
jgi:FKBP-type peptidyl-prolyl cis-trans isomerase (trigger factor)